MSQDDVLTLTLAKPADAPIGVTLQSHGDGESSATLPTVIAVRSDGAAAALILVDDTLLSINGEPCTAGAAAASRALRAASALELVVHRRTATPPAAEPPEPPPPPREHRRSLSDPSHLDGLAALRADVESSAALAADADADADADAASDADAADDAAADASDDDDVTAWRRGAEDDGDGDEAELDGRVEGAFAALNEAIASNNEVEAAYASARRSWEATQSAEEGELGELQKKYRRQLRRLSAFDHAKREARRAGDELQRTSEALAMAEGQLELAQEALQLQNPARQSGGEAEAAWRVATALLEARRAEAHAKVRTLRADRRYWTKNLDRLTKHVLREARDLGSVAEGGAGDALAKEHRLRVRKREQEEELRRRGHETQAAKGAVRDAMRQLEAISIEIQQERAAPT